MKCTYSNVHVHIQDSIYIRYARCGTDRKRAGEPDAVGKKASNASVLAGDLFLRWVHRRWRTLTLTSNAQADECRGAACDDSAG